MAMPASIPSAVQGNAETQLGTEGQANSMLRAVAIPMASFAIPRFVGFGIARAIYSGGDTAAYDAKVALLSEYDLGYVYVSAFVLSLTVAWLNYFPVLLKNRFMHILGNLRSNLFIYKVMDATDQDSKRQPHVVLDQEGGIGQYNRANRSMHHFTENVGGHVLCILFAGFVFPRPAMVATVLLCIGRVLHQIGYVAVGFGGHGVGFFFWTFSAGTLEMLVLIAACKAM